MSNSKYIEKAMELRSEPMCPNCAETIMMTFAEDIGLSEDQARALGTNFGGGMKSGSVCGAVTSSLMVLGALGVTDPSAEAPQKAVLTDPFSKKERDRGEELLKRCQLRSHH